MNVLFVIPHDKELHSIPYFGNNGVLSIASYIKSLGHNVKIEDRTLKFSNFKKLLKSFKPNIVGISFISCCVMDDAIKISKLVHKKNIPIVWGGYGPIAFPEIILKEDFVDFVSIGEGEYTWRDLLNAMSKKQTASDISGLAYKNNRGEIVVNPMAPLIDLRDLPVLDYSLIKPSNYSFPFYNSKSMIYMFDGKGCPYQCMFCANKFYNKCKLRSRNMDDVISEVHSLSFKYGFDGFFFMKELFAVNKKELYQKCDSLSKLGEDIKWGCMLRITMYSSEDYDYMYKCGCRWIFFGVESASAEVIKNMKKNTDISNAEVCIVDCHKAGIMPYASFIFGFQDETEDNIKETISLIKNIFPIAKIGYNFFSPVFCSQSYNDLVNLGRIKEPESLKEISISMCTKLSDNYSLIKTIDLKVIYYYFMFISLISKKNYPKKYSGGMFAEIANIFKKCLFKFGLKHCVKMVYFLSFLGTKILWYTFMFPGIRKKYDLPLKFD